jgi:hypothetical protein
MACCLVHARACWIESSRSPVEHSRSYPWTCWSKSVRTFAFAPPRHTRPLCLREGTSKPSTQSSQCNLISSTAFSSTAFDVFYARLYCPLGGSAPNRRIAAPPALRATFLLAVATSARRRPVLLTPRPTAGLSRSLAPRVSALRRTPELRPRYGHRVPASRAIALHHNSS